MRTVWLIILGLIAYVVAMVVLFPAAPVVERIKPQLGQVAIEGVSGKLYKGLLNSVRSTDDLLPLEFNNVGWTLAPGTLLKGGAGASISFEGYGGEGEGLVSRSWNGDINVNDLTFTLQAKELETLLPVPIASFNGELVGDISKITLQNELLTEFDGTLIWNDAELESPIRANLVEVRVQIDPQGDESHRVTLDSSGGDVILDGTVDITASGDFSADILFTPSADAPPELLNALRQIGSPDAEGRVRFVREGNVNRLM